MSLLTRLEVPWGGSRGASIPGRDQDRLDRGQPLAYTYDEDTFDCQRTSPHGIKLCVGHPTDKQLGKLGQLLTHAGWWRCTFMLGTKSTS